MAITKVPCGGFAVGGGLSVRSVPTKIDYEKQETETTKNVLTDGALTLKILVDPESAQKFVGRHSN